MSESVLPSDAKIARHALVWPRMAAHAELSAQVAEGAPRDLARAWLAAGRPLVVSRQPDGMSRDQLAVGLALPPPLLKCRVALELSRADIARTAPPLQLAAVILHAPVAWQAALRELDHAAKNIGMALRVYGSFSWQTVSGLPYVTAASDIDLLWQARSPAQLQQGIALLLQWEQSSGLRADGEVLFGGDRAVSWREWLHANSTEGLRVLVKRDHGVALSGTRELLELLA